MNVLLNHAAMLISSASIDLDDLGDLCEFNADDDEIPSSP